MAPLPIVLLPGMDGTATLFADFVSALPASLRAVPIAYPGDRIMRYRDLVDFVEERLPGGAFALLGESFSSPVALAIAARRPPGLRGVVITAGFARSLLPRALLAVARPAMFRSPPPDALIRRMLTGRDADPSLVAAVRAAMAAVRPEVMAARLEEIVTVDATSDLERCAAPILYLEGSADRLVGRDAPALVLATRPDVTRVRLDAPHLLLQRRPALAAAVIATFLDGDPALPRPPRILLVCASSSRGNTRRVADAMAEGANASVVTPGELDVGALGGFDVVGFGSGVRYGRLYPELLSLVDRLPPGEGRRAFVFSTSGVGMPRWNRALRSLLDEKGYVLVGDFACKGQGTVGPLARLAGVRRGHPTVEDLARARAFGARIAGTLSAAGWVSRESILPRAS